jgi:hypothetical protein
MVVFITYNPVVICKTSVGEAILEMCTETGIKLTVLQMKVLFKEEVGMGQTTASRPAAEESARRESVSMSLCR